MVLVILAIEDHVEIKQHSAAVEFVGVFFLIRVQRGIILWEGGCCVVFRGRRVRVFEERGVASGEEKGEDGSVLLIDYT